MLLIVSVLGVSLFIYNWVYFSLADNGAIIRKSLACLRQSRQALAAATTRDDVDRANSAFAQCNAAINQPKGTFMLGGIALVLALATVLYLAVPRWRLRRRQLVAFTAEDDPEIAAALEQLALDAGLRRPPRFVWNPLNRVPTGLAFGRPGRRYIALSGALVTRYHTDRPAFRAVVLHELSHLRNRDVDQTYLTVMLWYAFVLAAVAPFVPTLFDEGARTIWDLGWRLAALTVVVYLTRNAVLRSREVYADVRASLVEPAGIRSVLGSLREPAGRRRRLVGLHPDPRRRLAAVEDTDRLFSLGVVAVVGTGIVATIAYQEVVTLVGFYDLEYVSTMWWSAVVFAPLAAAVLVFGIWRGVFAALARGRRVVRPFALGAALGAGFLIGQELSLSSVISHEDVILGAAWRNLVWALVLVGGLGLFAVWVAATARLWLPVAGSRSPRLVSAAAFGVSGLVLTVGMGIFFLVRATRAAVHVSTVGTALEHDRVASVVWAGPKPLYQFVRDPEIAIFAQRPAVWPAVILLWAFPLAALLVGARRRRRDLAWATLEPPPLELEQPRARLARAAAIGAAGAIGVVLAALVLRVAVRNGVTVATRGHDEFLLAFYVWSVSLGLAAQGLVAALTAATCRTAGLVLGLFAAAITAVGGAVSVFALPSFASCVDFVAIRSGSPCSWSVEGSFIRQTFEQMLAQGTLVALVGGSLGVLGAALVERRRRPTPNVVDVSQSQTV